MHKTRAMHGQNINRKIGNLKIDADMQIQIEKLCAEFGVVKLSLFGSILRNDFHEQSDIDILVEFREDSKIGLDFITLEEKLSELFQRKADLNSPEMLHKYFKDKVLREAKVLYGKA